MKYIRTKDGLFELIWNVIEKNGKQFIVEKFDGVIYEEEIIAQADTIEELCDEFVIEDENEWAIFHNLKLAKQTKGTIYGAIHIEDKGLIYVAKLNEEGEFELL